MVAPFSPGLTEGYAAAIWWHWGKFTFKLEKLSIVPSDMGDGLMSVWALMVLCLQCCVTFISCWCDTLAKISR